MNGDADFEGFDGYGVYVGQVLLVELERCFFLGDVDLALIGKRRGDHNRLGFAVQLGTVRYLGLFLSDPTAVPVGVVDYMARQIRVADPSCLKHYLDRRSTRFAHAAEIAGQYGYRDFNVVEADLAGWINDRAWTTGDGPKALFDGAAVWLGDRRVLLPGRTRLDRLVAQEREQSTQRLFDVLASMVTPTQAVRLDALLDVPDGARVSVLERRRTGPTSRSGVALIAALDRVVEIETLGFTAVDDAVVLVRRRVELARWGMAGKAQSLRRHPENRPIATLLATARHLEGRSIDDAIEVFDVLMTNDLMAKARREAKTGTLRRYRLVARDAAICAAVVEVLLGPDGPDTLSELWVTITGIVSRPCWRPRRRTSLRSFLLQTLTLVVNGAKRSSTVTKRHAGSSRNFAPRSGSPRPQKRKGSSLRIKNGSGGNFGGFNASSVTVTNAGATSFLLKANGVVVGNLVFCGFNAGPCA